MTKKTFLIIIPIIAILAALLIYTLTKEVQKDQVIQQVKQEVVNTITKDLSTNGLYAPYNATIMNSVKDDTKIVVFFHDPACSNCKSLDRDIIANIGNIQPDTLILKENFSTSELKLKYKINDAGGLVKINKLGDKISSTTDVTTYSGLVEFVNK
jgi:thioredoxin-related protein